MTSEPRIDTAQLNRRVAALSTERTSLFARASTSVGGLAPQHHERLHTIERELDECYTALRLQRAVRDADRFSREDPTMRRAIPRRAPPAS